MKSEPVANLIRKIEAWCAKSRKDKTLLKRTIDYAKKRCLPKELLGESCGEVDSQYNGEGGK